MTECNRCGACCDPVKLNFHPDAMTGPSAPFAREHWHFLEVAEYPGFSAPIHLVECDAYDRETRTCTARDERPPICSGYPWYGGVVNDRVVLDPSCSFNADTRINLPIVGVNHA